MNVYNHIAEKSHVENEMSKFKSNARETWCVILVSES